MPDAYAQPAVHRWMLRDEVRNEAYRKAIAQVVKPGDVVLDMGAGSGILSIFAAQAGARKVYAVERTAIARLARRMIERNGVSDRVEVIQGDLEDVDLPEKVDVLVSEWMGEIGVDENMLAPLVMARRRWLKPGGVIVPGRVTAYLAPVWMSEIDEELGYWRAPRHGVDFGLLAELAGNETSVVMSPIAAEDLLAAPGVLWGHDAYTCSLEEADRSFEATLTFTALRDGAISALAGWFRAELAEGVVLDTAPGEPLTHWGRRVFPLAGRVAVRQGERIEVAFRCDPTAPGTCEFAWSVKVGDGAVEAHDSRGSRV